MHSLPQRTRTPEPGTSRNDPKAALGRSQIVDVGLRIAEMLNHRRGHLILGEE